MQNMWLFFSFSRFKASHTIWFTIKIVIFGFWLQTLNTGKNARLSYGPILQEGCFDHHIKYTSPKYRTQVMLRHISADHHPDKACSSWSSVSSTAITTKSQGSLRYWIWEAKCLPHEFLRLNHVSRLQHFNPKIWPYIHTCVCVG